VQPARAASTGLLLQMPGGVRAQISNECHIPLAAALVCYESFCHRTFPRIGVVTFLDERPHCSRPAG